MRQGTSQACVGASGARILAALLLALVGCGADTKHDKAPLVSLPGDADASDRADAAAARGDAAASAASSARPGVCLAKEELPRNCKEACLDQGRSCAEDCNFGTPLPAVAGYYASLSGCEKGQGTVFAITAGCDDSFDPAGFLPYAAVRCCCAAGNFKVASVGETTPLCETACAKDTSHQEQDCNMFGGCGETCLDATRGLDLSCARCLIDHVGFSPSYCSSWECVCGGASFPSEWSTECAAACGATQQHERELYEAEPRPVPVGRAPSARIDAPAIPDILDLLVDAQGQVWALGSSRDQEGRPRLALAVFDADLRLRWRWDAPAQRPVERWSGMARLAAEVVLVARFADGQSALLFFDSQGSLREQATSVREPLALAALGDKLLVMDRPSVNEANSLTILDASGAVRFAAPRSWFDGFARWVHTAHADASVSLFSGFEGVLSWRRAVPPADLATGSASVLWTRQLALGPVDAAGAAALGEDVLVWGSLREQRANWSAGFPWVAQLSGDGSVRFQWSNGRLSTPGQVRDAVQTSAGITCTGGDESWEDELPAPGPRCSPDGCNALTVRCFDTGGKELWKYHHRSERSEAYSLATDSAGRRLYVAGNITRDQHRSTGSRAVLMRFEL